jgi:ubiquitin carboxyl-terminal hydrolase 35/38
MQTYDFTKEKTPVKIDEGLWIGGYEYELYNTIIHSGKDAHSGHYYAIGRRSEPTPGGDCGWYTMDDSEIKEPEGPEVSLLTGNPPEELVNDNAYVLFLRCKQAPPTLNFESPCLL